MPTKRERMFQKAAEQKAGQVGLGRAVTHLREQAGLTPEELAKRADLSQSELVAIERGEVDPTWGDLRRIAYALNVELDNLLELGIEMAPGPAGDRLRQQEAEKRDFQGRAADEDEGDPA
jgi:transcriptional regulator with XRE-family HTH domain